jgi:hypothetical protein
MFSSSGPGYVAQHDVLLQAITHNLWPILGITSPVADGLWVWMHFCEVHTQIRPFVISAAVLGLIAYTMCKPRSTADGWSRPGSYNPSNKMLVELVRMISLHSLQS